VVTEEVAVVTAEEAMEAVVMEEEVTAVADGVMAATEAATAMVADGVAGGEEDGEDMAATVDITRGLIGGTILFTTPLAINHRHLTRAVV